jgi:hypothetical protein
VKKRHQAEPQTNRAGTDFLNNYANLVITTWLEAGGTLVNNLEYKTRLSICKACPKAGQVTVTAHIAKDVPGCTICGCPFATKLKARTYTNIFGEKVVSSCPLDKW